MPNLQLSVEPQDICYINAMVYAPSKQDPKVLEYLPSLGICNVCCYAFTEEFVAGRLPKYVQDDAKMNEALS